LKTVFSFYQAIMPDGIYLSQIVICLNCDLFDFSDYPDYFLPQRTQRKSCQSFNPANHGSDSLFTATVCSGYLLTYVSMCYIRMQLSATCVCKCMLLPYVMKCCIRMQFPVHAIRPCRRNGILACKQNLKKHFLISNSYYLFYKNNSGKFCEIV
jgi:hypothetical protein